MLVSPSILAADILNLGNDVAAVEKAGADLLHVDVMDGHFVPNLSFGLPLITALKQKTKLPLDVHIMISNPDQMAEEYVKAGASYLTFHPQASKNPLGLAAKLKGLGAKIGLALDPELDPEILAPYLQHIDLVLLMAVKPGFGGQKFMPATYERLSKLVQMREGKNLEGKNLEGKNLEGKNLEGKNLEGKNLEGKNLEGKNLLLSVDGGVTEENAPKLRSLGAGMLVAGSYVFKHPSWSKAIELLRGK